MLLIFATGIYVFAIARGRNDLDIFLAASADLFSGVAIYTKYYFEGYNYFYSVLFATIIYPLTFLPPEVSKAFWIIVSIVMLYRIRKIAVFFLGDMIGKIENKSLPVIISFAVLLYLIHSNLRICQMTIPILYLTLESLFLIYRKKPLYGGLLLALAINVKLLPVVFLPYLLYRAEWKALLTVLIVIPVLFYIPSTWLGIERNSELLYSWSNLINPRNSHHVADIDEPSFNSITSFLAVYLTDTSHDWKALPLKRNILSLTLNQLEIVIQIVRLMFILFTLYFLRSRPFIMAQSKESWWWETSYLFLAAVLIFPHQQFYAFLLAFPSVIWILVKYLTAPDKKQKPFLQIKYLLIFVLLCFNASLLLGVYNAWYQHYKIVTFGAFALVAALALSKPENKSVSQQAA